MPTLTTTRMSSKGQVVIPKEIRDRLGLRSGTQFVVVGDRDVVILKAISAPSMKEFDRDDPSDGKFLEAAVAGNASCIISGDKRLLKLSEFQGIQILKPIDFAQRYLKSKGK